MIHMQYRGWRVYKKLTYVLRNFRKSASNLHHWREEDMWSTCSLELPVNVMDMYLEGNWEKGPESRRQRPNVNTLHRKAPVPGFQPANPLL